LGVTQAELVVSLRIAVDQCVHSEALNEPLQLALGDGTLVEVHEVSSNATLRKESQRFSGVRAFPGAENLNFHSAKAFG
jgi:hypothetical protein